MWRLRGRKAVALTRGDLTDGRQGGAAEPVPAQDVPGRAGAAGLSADPRYAAGAELQQRPEADAGPDEPSAAACRQPRR